MELRDWERWWTDCTHTDSWRSKERERAWRFEMVAQMASEMGKSVLEVGCASCYAYPYFEKRKMKYTGLDITKKFLDLAVELYPEITVHHANIIDLPFLDNSFDTTVCINVLSNLHPDEYHIALDQLIRVASKQVIIILGTRFKPSLIFVNNNHRYYTIWFNEQDLTNKILDNRKVKDLKITELKRGVPYNGYKGTLCRILLSNRKGGRPYD